MAVLSATHWMREHLRDPAPMLAFALGVMPNVAAAFAMPLVLASFFPSATAAVAADARRAFWRILAFTTFGLCGWEIVQTRSDRFVFDTYDLLATGVGSTLARLAFVWHARRSTIGDQTVAHGGEG